MTPSEAWLHAIGRCPIGSTDPTHYWSTTACKCAVPVPARKACPVRSLDPAHYTTGGCACVLTAAHTAARPFPREDPT